MALKARWFILLPALFFLFLSQSRLKHIAPSSYPSIQKLINTPRIFQDAVFVATGFRRLAADVAWIELLQEVGDVGRVDETDINYPNLKRDTLRVMRIDPYFHSATMFGAVTLAWIRSINRPDEALEVLEEGIRSNPTYWPFRTLVASLGFMRSDEFERMIRLLADTVTDPECPAITKVILANAYKSHGHYAEAIAIWKSILDVDGARDYHQRAKQEIQILETLAS